MLSQAAPGSSEKNNSTRLGSSLYYALFWIRAKPVLVTHQCFGYCWIVLAQHSKAFYPSQGPSLSKVGIGKRLGRCTARPVGQEDTPYHIISCSAIKTEVKIEEWGNRILLLSIHPKPNIAKNLPDDNLSVMVSCTIDCNGQLIKNKYFQCLWSNICKLRKL